MFRKIVISAILVFIFFSISSRVFATELTFPEGMYYNYGGSMPDSNETSYMPLVPVGMRYKVKVHIIGDEHVNLKFPIKVNFDYDTTKAIAGRTLPVTISLAPAAPGTGVNSFAAGFGYKITSTTELGIVSIPGVPDVLPWYNTGLDLFGLLGAIPEVGPPLAAIKDLINIDLSGTEALPLGSTKSYSEQKTLIDVTSAMLDDEVVKAAVLTKVKGVLGTTLVGSLKTLIKTLKDVDDSGATSILDGVLKNILGAFSLKIVAEPIYKVEGVEADLMLDYGVTNRTANNSYPISATSGSQVQTINIGIPAFSTADDKVYLTVRSVTYEFRVKKQIKFTITFPLVGDINVYDTDEHLFTSQKITQVPSNSVIKTIEIPVTPAVDTYTNYRSTPGCIAAAVMFASPKIPLKATYYLFQSGSAGQLANALKQVAETDYYTSHGTIFDNLTPSTTYTVSTYAQDSTNAQLHLTPDQTFTTKPSGQCPALVEAASLYHHDITGVQVTPAADSISFHWHTDVPASSEIFLSTTPDRIYKSAVKKESGGIAWTDFSNAPGDREFTTDHDVVLTSANTSNEVAPDKMFYYTIRSWACELQYQNVNGKTVTQSCQQNLNELARLGVVGTVMTPQSATTATVRAKVQTQVSSTPMNAVPVEIYKGSETVPMNVLVSGSDGLTPWITIDKDTTYTFKVKGVSCYQDAAVSAGPYPTGQVANPVIINMATIASSSNYVLDTAGNPVIGATVHMQNRAEVADVTTDATGRYGFTGLIFNGNATVFASKTDYNSASVQGHASACGAFSAQDIILQKTGAVLNISVKAPSLAGNSMVAVPNAMITVKEGSDLIGSNIQTDAQGAAIFAHNYNDDLDHVLSVTITPMAGSNVQPQTVTTSLKKGQDKSLQISCSRSGFTASILNLRFKQFRNNAFQVLFDSTAQVINSIEYTTPGGTLLSTPWTANYVQNNNTVGVTVLSGNFAPGIFKIKVKVKDIDGNQAESVLTDFNVFGGAGWNFKAAAGTSQAIFTWSSYPSAENFGKYHLYVIDNVSGQERDFDVNNLGTLRQVVDNLVPGRQYQAGIEARFTDGLNLLSQGQAITFSTKTLPPQITSFNITPLTVGLMEPVQISFEASDPDSNIKSANIMAINKDGKKGKNKEEIYKQVFDLNAIQAQYQAKFKEAGNYGLDLQVSDADMGVHQIKPLIVLDSENPRIAFLNQLREIIINREFKPEINILNLAKLNGLLTLHIDWGDGKKEDIDLGEVGGKRSPRVSLRNIAHTYLNNEGTRNFTATAKIKLGKQELVSDPLTVALNVTLLHPILELTGAMRDAANTWSFHVRAQEGSYPIQNWRIEFGDGSPGQEEVAGQVREETRETGAKVTQAVMANSQLTSGKGPVDTNIIHTFRLRGNYTVKLIISDSNNNETIKQFPIETRKNSVTLGQGTLGGSAQNIRELGVAQVGVAGGRGEGGIGIDTRVANHQQQQATTVGQSGVGQAVTNQVQGVRSQVVEVKKEPIDISFVELRMPSREIMVGQSCDIEAILKNDSGVEIREVVVNFETEDSFKDRKNISIRPHSQERIKFSWVPRKEGRQKLTGMLECREDENTRNNSISQPVEVRPQPVEIGSAVNTATNGPELLKKKKVEMDKGGLIEEGTER